jgi:uncharacterized damage-inducible protein DinB
MKTNFFVTQKEKNKMQAEPKAIRMVDNIIAEIDQEAETTRRLLDLVPEDQLGWRPHPKAMSLGQLAMHIAALQGNIAELSINSTVEFTSLPPEPEAASREEIGQVFANSLRKAKEVLDSMDDAKAVEEWKLTKDGRTIFSSPRIAFWRAIMLNHNYHHRGQLSTYLRQLNVPLPSIYGPSADVNPFA